MAKKGKTVGFVVLAERPSLHVNGTAEHQTAGSIWPTRKPVENHQAYCQAKAKAEPIQYGDVKYVIGRVVIDE